MHFIDGVADNMIMVIVKLDCVVIITGSDSIAGWE